MFLFLGPFLIDWTGFRSTIEEYAEQALGQPVSVSGKTDIRLLPNPHLTFHDVRVGTTEAPLINIPELSLVADLPPLLRGELKVRELILTKPNLQLKLDGEGRLNWHAEKSSVESIFNPDAVVLDKFQVNDGRIKLSDARTGRTQTYSELNFSGSADSLAGPFEAKGDIVIAGIKHSVSIKTGRFGEQGKVNLIALAKPENYSVQIDMNGDYTNETGLPKFEGEFTLSSLLSEEEQSVDNLSIWNVSGKINVDSMKTAFNEIQIDYGPRDRLVRIEGNIERKFGQDSNYDLKLASNQIDLDRLFGNGPSDPVTAEFVANRLVSIVENLPKSTAIGKVELNFPSIVVNENVIQNVVIKASATSTGWRIEQFVANPPGETTLNSSGNILYGTTTSYIGELEIQSQQPKTLVGWWQDDELNYLDEYESFRLSSEIILDSHKIEFSSLEGQLGNDRISGNLVWETITEENLQQIVADLELGQLNVDQISSLASILSGDSVSEESEAVENVSRELDLKLRLEHFDLAGISATDMKAELSFKDGKYTITEISSQNVAGSSLKVVGELDDLVSLQDGSLTFNLDSPDLSGLLNSVQRIFPENKLIQQIRGNGESYSPISIIATYNADSTIGNTQKKLDFSGSVANSEVDFKIELVGDSNNWRENKLALDVELESSNGQTLYQQLGLDTVESSGSNTAKATVEFSGVPKDKLDLKLNLETVDTEVTITGKVFIFDDFDIDYDIDLNLSSNDLSPFLENRQEFLTWFSEKIPVKISTKFAKNRTGYELKDLNGSFSDYEFLGSISGKVSKEKQEYNGSLALNDLDFQSLIILILGNSYWGQHQKIVDLEQLIDILSSSYWSSQRFENPILENTELEFEVVTDKFYFTENFVAQNVFFKLRIEPNQLELRDLSGEIDNGKIAGKLIVRNSLGEVGVTGSIQLEAVSVENLVWQYQNIPAVTGVLDLDYNFQGSGRTMVELIGSLAGGGNYSLKNGEITGLDPNIFDQVLVEVDKGLELEESKINAAFEDLFSNTQIGIDEIGSNFTVTGGQLQTRNINFTSEDLNINLDANFNLKELSMESDWTLEKGLPEVVGATPKIDVMFSGPIRNPDSRKRVTDFVNYLTLRALDLETQKQDSQNAQILERERLFRELQQMKENLALRQVVVEPILPELQETPEKNEQQKEKTQDQLDFEKILEGFYPNSQDSDSSKPKNELEQTPKTEIEEVPEVELEEDSEVVPDIEPKVVPDLEPKVVPEAESEDDTKVDLEQRIRDRLKNNSQPPESPKLQPGEIRQVPLPPLGHEPDYLAPE